MNKRLILVVVLIAGLGCAKVNAAEITNLDRLKVTSKLIGAGLTGCAAAVGLEKLSPQTSLLATGTVMTGAVLVAARVICGADINVPNKAISLPFTLPDFSTPDLRPLNLNLRDVTPELNWFNAIAFTCAAAAYGLYKHSDKLVIALDHAIKAAAAVTQ